MLSHLPLSWHLPPARFMLCTMPYFWMTARYAALVYWLPRSECTMALYLLYPAVQRVDRDLQLLCCCFCWSKVFGELDRLHFVFLVVFSLLWHLRILHFSFFLFYSLVAYVSSFIIQNHFHFARHRLCLTTPVQAFSETLLLRCSQYDTSFPA